MEKRVRVIISGRVQGVCFRMNAYTEARRLGLRGWICNRPNGTVEAVAQGPAEAVDDFVRWCWQGPPMAVVRHVASVEEAAGGRLKPFTISG
ncbi:MAG: acylphosphatase [Lentisphaerae bacterium]|nr:acylphosphatase [Lentisphaerota bacterium]